jgi:hypothetical protein
MAPSSALVAMPTKERWQCPSTMPGISVMPPASISPAAASAAIRFRPSATVRIRLPSTSTSPSKRASRIPSKIIALRMSVAANAFLVVSPSDRPPGRRRAELPRPKLRLLPARIRRPPPRRSNFPGRPDPSRGRKP